MLAFDQCSCARGAPDREALVIGLVNNMPDGALETTEHQFRGLLDEASQNTVTYLRYFSLPGIPREPQARQYVMRSYEDLSELCSRPVDGLIVTGTEPRAASIENEPYWQAFRNLVDRVNDLAIPTIWSCLAAHAAVLDMDGIPRRPLREKLSGVFQCRKVLDHEILRDGPGCWSVPHSRWNGLAEEELIAKGYRILSRSPKVGADMFVLERNTLFIFLQGHLEYDPEALFREYRRDVRRFLAGTREDYPAMPCGYFTSDVAVALAAFKETAMNKRDTNALLHFPKPAGTFAWDWRQPALRLYANWLSCIAQRRSRRQIPVRDS